jgi:hypothetical protein
MGDINKSWKKRYFVIGNAKNNFKIEYFESDGVNLKGSINAAGYFADTFDAAETRTHGPFGIKLVPYSPLRRTWYFKAENEIEKDEWFQVLDAICARVSSP